MAVVSLSYILDVNSFQLLIHPAIEKLKKGDPEPLRELAHKIAGSSSSIWKVLEDYRLYPSDLGSEDQEFETVTDRTSFWIMIILASFLVPIEAPHLSPDSRRLLSDLGWNESEIEQLLLGNPEITLLQPELTNSPLVSRARIWDWPEWSRFGRNPRLAGWLNLEDVGRLLEKLTMQREAVVQRKDQRLLTEYDSLIAVLAAAANKRKGLFMAIAD